jgi:hypothetical protein
VSAGGRIAPQEVLVVLDPSPDVHPEEAARLGTRLRRELMELDIGSVATVASANAAPAGTKGVDVAEWGSLLVTLSSGGVLAHLVGVLRDWLKRQSGDHTVSVTIDGDKMNLSNATAQEQARLVEAYVRRHCDK